jgi:hypothetical protein
VPFALQHRLMWIQTNAYGGLTDVAFYRIWVQVSLLASISLSAIFPLLEDGHTLFRMLSGRKYGNNWRSHFPRTQISRRYGADRARSNRVKNCYFTQVQGYDSFRQAAPTVCGELQSSYELFTDFLEFKEASLTVLLEIPIEILEFKVFDNNLLQAYNLIVCSYRPTGQFFFSSLTC